MAPANLSQAPRSGAVDVEVDFGAGVAPATFRASMQTGIPSEAVDVTDRFTVSPGGATAGFTGDDLSVGVTRLDVSVRAAKGAERDVASVAWSWEPNIRVDATDGCDFLSRTKCLLPFPNDYYTVADPTSDTGRRVHIAAGATPVNAAGVHVDPTEWNRNDGFSPGSAGVAYVPGIDLTETGAAPVTDIQRSLDADAPIVVIDADTLERHPRLGGARQQGDERRHQSALHPPGDQLPGGPPLHLRHAPAEGLGGRDDQAEPGVPRLPRSVSDLHRRRRRPSASHGGDLLDPGRRRHRPR
ncbi:MAG: hypothetical protein M5T61_04560 [Acidimicrobiia bacterium]|nr:hypothetical protein [Acidimicrobiia bacterium]